MEIKFNLEEAKIFIPLGRKGNLKKMLWDNINLSGEDLKAISVGDQSNQNEVLEASFENKINSLSNESEASMTSLLDSYLKNSSKALVEKQINKLSKDSFLDLMMEASKMLQNSQERVMKNPEVEKKMLKLRKIQQFNELKGD